MLAPRSRGPAARLVGGRKGVAATAAGAAVAVAVAAGLVLDPSSARSAAEAAAAAAKTGGTPPGTGPDGAARTPDAAAGTAAARKRGIGRKRLARKLKKLIDSAGSASGVWAGEADGAAGKRIYDRREEDSRTLASNQKLFTTAAALDRLGPGRRLRTRVLGASPTARGVVRGGIYLVGDGDPALGGRSFARRRRLPVTPLGRLARQISGSEVRKIRGGVLADDTIFDRTRGVPASGGRTSIYIGPLSGLSYNSGIAGGRFADDPAIVAAKKLRKGLRRRGVEVRGRVRLGDAPEDGLDGSDAPIDAIAGKTGPLAAVRSPRLGELVEQTNRMSNNFFAEMLLKRLDAEDSGRGTTAGGARRLERFARRLGLTVEAADGSGLTRANRASPEEVGRLLVAMHSHPAQRVFAHSLPLAGRQGTLAERMRGSAADGRCRAKTGTLTGISTLSGYCRAGGGTVAFSILMNGVDVSRARALQDRMVALIARYRG